MQVMKGWGAKESKKGSINFLFVVKERKSKKDTCSGRMSLISFYIEIKSTCRRSLTAIIKFWLFNL